MGDNTQMKKSKETALQRALRNRQQPPDPDQWFTTYTFANETKQHMDAARRELETFPGIKRQTFRGDLYWSFEDDKPGTTAPSK